ncbi:MAG: HD domain-containing protein [Treponemataceae bacterium]|nr:HD domain-containing protein [Treponemataceae bacterium]
MKFLIYSMIAVGIVVMVTNIIRYIRFMLSMNDVLNTSRHHDKIWKQIGLLLLIFFLFGYIVIAIFSKPDIMMASVLFGGSFFVMIVLTLMFHLIASLKENCLDVAEVLISIIENRDPNLNGHSRNVQKITMLFYKYLPNSIQKQINPISLEYAALMHDVGKLGIPEEVLNKPAKLNDEEWAIMKQHPKIGVKFLEPLHNFKDIMPWIEYHHERIDGKGYYSIPEDQIPLAAKIIAIADTYSAITMKRVYKDPKTHETALEIISQVAGTQLDKDLVKIFLTIPQKELAECVPPNLETWIKPEISTQKTESK